MPLWAQRTEAVLIMFGVVLFIWSLFRWSNKLHAKEERERRDFLNGLKFVAIREFDDKGQTLRANYTLKTLLFVWCDPVGVEYVSDYASHVLRKSATKVDAKDAKEQEYLPENLRPLQPLEPVSNWRELMPVIEYDE